MAQQTDEGLPPYTPIAEPRAALTAPQPGVESARTSQDTPDLPPPAYDSPYGTLNIHENALDTSARITGSFPHPPHLQI